MAKTACSKQAFYQAGKDIAKEENTCDHREAPGDINLIRDWRRHSNLKWLRQLSADGQASSAQGAAKRVRIAQDLVGELSVGDYSVPVVTPRDEDTAAVQAGEAEQQRASVLVVEDDPVTAKFIQYSLAEDFNVTSASDAQTALALARSRMFNVVLLDINLPRYQDGIAALKELKQIAGYDDARLIAMTIASSTSDREDYLEIGFDEFLGKPFTVTQVRTMVAAPFE